MSVGVPRSPVGGTGREPDVPEAKVEIRCSASNNRVIDDKRERGSGWPCFQSSGEVEEISRLALSAVW